MWFCLKHNLISYTNTRYSSSVLKAGLLISSQPFLLYSTAVPNCFTGNLCFTKSLWDKAQKNRTRISANLRTGFKKSYFSIHSILKHIICLLHLWLSCNSKHCISHATVSYVVRIKRETWKIKAISFVWHIRLQLFSGPLSYIHELTLLALLPFSMPQASSISVRETAVAFTSTLS